MKKLCALCFLVIALLSACSGNKTEKGISMITQNVAIVQQTIDSLKAHNDNLDEIRAAKGVQQAASLWTETDGTAAEFTAFCVANYVNNEDERQKLFYTLSDKFELLFGYFNLIDINLKKPIHETGYELQDVDYEMGGYDVSAHFSSDMFANKVAFTTMLNFPSYSLPEKEEQGGQWSSLQWGYARLGDLFTSRIPAEIKQNVSATLAAAENYIMDYNIMMGELRNDKNEALFPEGMKLISHWNLRDELKSNYADAQRGLEKQRMVYTVMKRIVMQEIPEKVINNNKVLWNPISNKVFEDDKEIAAAAEPDTRYKMLLNNFNALKAEDPYTPLEPTYIKRAFDGSMEFSKDEVKAMFTTFISSQQVKEVATLIENRLGRKLEPFDIWYDGFKARSSISEEALTSKTSKLYPHAKAFEYDLPAILQRLGFSKAEADRICGKIQVDAARGSGHAWGATMKGDKAHLRTRIPENGMDYKGYNIAMHELGHNVEQTISLYDVEYYLMNGVPNTAFTEALAFVFQKRDLEVLGITEQNPNKENLQTLDIFWGCYEIMGVALVDIGVWEWLYTNPNATPVQLKENVLRIAREVWNSYYAPVLGELDSPILSVYSHMINSPLYLANYPMGHLIEFQLEEHLRGKNFATEVERIYRMGRYTPQLWMKRATGHEVSIESMLNATEKAVGSLQ